MIKSILSQKQKLFLSLFSQNISLSRNFYLTGGTALAEFYIPYRYSEDLDFFSENEISLLPITVFLKSIKDKIKYKRFDINRSFNRNIVQLIFEDQTLKLEFTYFPFPQIEKPKIKDGIKIDSLEDIAVNKIFTIYQHPRSRDFTDIYMICQTYPYKIINLLKKARVKFDWHIDPIQLGSQLLQIKELKDYPKLINKIDTQVLLTFFEKEAKQLKQSILK